MQFYANISDLSHSIMKKANNIPERKVIERNRRNNMKILYSQLFSLVPDRFKSEGNMEISERINETINYIESLKANIEKMKDKKKSHAASASQSLGIQIHEMSPDVDVVMITGLKNHSIFCDIIRVLNQCSAEVRQANFSVSGLCTFHVHGKKIEVTDIYRRLNGLLTGSSKIEEPNIHVQSCLEEEGNLDLWDFEICSDVWFMG
ncbi:transcription factor bHLH162-like [Helianthus annuus]|uniref:transcription factor bHLH162-like n=1 Tax=Helianthus annuus TaxID=4232 RepID=UPI001652D664|nr:transcription factor bHLH162-like [Helianthus annuus]